LDFAFASKALLKSLRAAIAARAFANSSMACLVVSGSEAKFAAAFGFFRLRYRRLLDPERIRPPLQAGAEEHVRISQGTLLEC
jgi:hypothetical protein